MVYFLTLRMSIFF